MIKCRRLPTCGSVALSAVLPKLTVVRVIFGVAREAVLRSAAILLVRMAFLAFDRGMLPGELEVRQPVVKFGWLPAFYVVAGGTILPEAALMGIFLRVAGGAVLGSRLQVSDQARPGVAGGAINGGVFPFQVESDLVMVGCFPVALPTVVTPQAAFTEGLKMSRHPGCLHLLVTVRTGRHGKAGEFSCVAIRASEGCAI